MLVKVKYDHAKQETVFIREIRVPDDADNTDIAKWIRLGFHELNGLIQADLTDEEWDDLCSRAI